jgi:hypothetical protein
MLKEGRYNIKTDQYEFLMTVYEYEGIYRIRYGDPSNREGPCIDFTYKTKAPTKLKLDNLMYKNICSKDGNLKKGDGTIHMVKSALILLCKEFPDIKKIMFNDVASIECKGRNLLLAHMYIPCYGDTWYSKHFDAKPVDKQLAKLIRLINLELMKSQSTPIFPSIPKQSSPSQTWMEYFYTRKSDCEFFIQIEDDIKSHFDIPLSYSEWYISAKSVNQWAQDIPVKYQKTSTQTGGAPWKTQVGHRVG